MPRFPRITVASVTLLAPLVLAGGTSAEPPVTEDPPPATETAPPKKVGPPPSLDELLGIGGAKDDGDAGATGEDPAAADETRTGDAELDAALGLKRLDDMFRLAIDGMREATDQLQDRRTGLATQRTQEEVMRRLEMLIDAAAEQQQQQQQSSSSSSSNSRQQQQQDPGQQQSRGQQEQQQSQQEGQAEAGQQSGEGMPPGFQDGLLESELGESGEEWGALPERIREMLLQGRNERFSSLYERLTRAYYRRLAEEGTP